MHKQSNIRSDPSSQPFRKPIDRRVASVDGEKLLLRRQAIGLTQEQVAEKAGVDLRQVKQAEGYGRLMVRNVPLLAKALDLKPSWQSPPLWK